MQYMISKEWILRQMFKVVWFLKLYIRQYYLLLAFLAVFVLGYILFMHWLNIRLLNRLRRSAALAGLVVELAAIIGFTLLFREAGASRRYELELFWSYKQWIFGCKQPLSAASRAAFPGQSGPY